jgi:hypothetical protein
LQQAWSPIGLFLVKVLTRWPDLDRWHETDFKLFKNRSFSRDNQQLFSPERFDLTTRRFKSTGKGNTEQTITHFSVKLFQSMQL